MKNIEAVALPGDYVSVVDEELSHGKKAVGVVKELFIDEEVKVQVEFFNPDNDIVNKDKIYKEGEISLFKGE